MYAFIGIHTEAIKLMDLLLPFVDLWSEITSTERIGLGINNALNMGTKHLFINNTIAVINLIILKQLMKNKSLVNIRLISFIIIVDVFILTRIPSLEFGEFN